MAALYINGVESNMGIIKRNCPHCETKSMAFSAISAIQKHGSNVWLTSFRCNGCHGGYFAEIENRINGSPKEIDGNIENNQYFRTIKSLESDGLITGDLKDWAHIIREDGNESAHEEEPVTREFAEEIISFTELFLLYVFTMPGMVKAKKPEHDV